MGCCTGLALCLYSCCRLCNEATQRFIYPLWPCAWSCTALDMMLELTAMQGSRLTPQAVLLGV